MKLLLYSRAFPPAIGGMERYAEDLAGWMAARGHSVTVITRTTAAVQADHARPYRVIRGRPLIAERVFSSADVVHVNGLSLKAIAAALIARHRPVVTHAGYQSICPVGLAWSAKGGCEVAARTSVCCSVCPQQGFAGRSNVRLHRAGAAAAAVNVCVSRYLAERAHVPRSVTIYNPVSDVAFKAELGSYQEDDVIVFAGRLVTEKGLDLLLHAMSLMPNVRLRIAGEGPMRVAWERLAVEIGVDRRVKFLGIKSFTELVELYREAAVVCVPTLSPESFGYTAAEAMAMGRAVVATPSGALPELLADGRGFVALSPTPEALAKALYEALEDVGRRKAAERKAREFAQENLSMEYVGPKYEAVYRAAAS